VTGKLLRSKSEIISLLTNPGVIAVVRVQKAEQVLPVAEALIAGGVIAIELTMTTPNAIEAIHEASKKLGARALIGVGTVLDAATCRAAIAAGAEFVVSPIMRPEIAAAARALDKPAMLGAYTPTEAQLAHEAGADFIKIFPSDGLGPNYIKALLAPLPHLKIIPTGIATPELVPQFITAGCVGVGLGSLLTPSSALEAKDWHGVTQRAMQFVAAVGGVRQK